MSPVRPGTSRWPSITATGASAVSVRYGTRSLVINADNGGVLTAPAVRESPEPAVAGEVLEHRHTGVAQAAGVGAGVAVTVAGSLENERSPMTVLAP